MAPQQASTEIVEGARIGHEAPGFELSDQQGRIFRLSSLRGGVSVVYFFPRINTRGCTAETCAFRDASPEFAALSGAEQAGPGGAVRVVGVTRATVADLHAFAGRQRVPFTLLADEQDAVRTLWRVPRTLGLLPGRVTYVLDRSLVVRAVINSQIRPLRHVREALEHARRLVETSREAAGGPAGAGADR